MLCQASPIRRNAGCVPRARSQRTTPRSVPMARIRPSIHRDGRILAMGTDRGVVLWDLARGTQPAFLRIGLAWHSMFEPSGDLVTNGSAGVLRWPIHIDPTSGEARI